MSKKRQTDGRVYKTPYQTQVYVNRLLKKGPTKGDYLFMTTALKFYRSEYAKWKKKKYTSKSWKTRRKNMLWRYSRWAFDDLIRVNIEYFTDAPFNLYEEFGPLNPVDYPEAFFGSLYNKWLAFINAYFGGDEEWGVLTSRALTAYYNREELEKGDEFSM